MNWTAKGDYRRSFPVDVVSYRDHLLTKRYAPTTINRALISLMLFFDTIEGTNPFRRLSMIDIVEPAPVALSKTEWNDASSGHSAIAWSCRYCNHHHLQKTGFESPRL